MRRRALLVIAAQVVLAVAVATAGPSSAAESPGPSHGGIAVIGDFGSGTGAEGRVATLVRKAHPEVVVTTGDNVYGSPDYAGLVGRYYGTWIAKGTFFPAVGNHDYEQGIEAFDAAFPYLEGRHLYSRVVGDVQFFVVDSEAAITSDAERSRQRRWLAKVVPRSTAAWQVVVLHHPPYSSGATHGSTTQTQWPYRAWGVDLVLAGHEHQYERIQRAGVTYVVDGAGGKDLYAFGRPIAGSKARVERFGAVFLRADARALVGEFWTAAGHRADRFVLTR